MPLPLREVELQRVVPGAAERRPPHGEAVVELRERPQRLRDGGGTQGIVRISLRLPPPIFSASALYPGSFHATAARRRIR